MTADGECTYLTCKCTYLPCKCTYLPSLLKHKAFQEDWGVATNAQANLGLQVKET